MSEETSIAWTDSSFNIAWGCVKVSPGCQHCYAESLAKRYGHDVWGKHADRRIMSEGYWLAPLKWNKLAQAAGVRHRVFTSSMCDVFEDHPIIAQQRERLWHLIRETPWLDWQILTKRASRIAANLPADWGVGWANVWLGVSVENSDYLQRIDYLRGLPAVVRFVSYEPALGPLENANLGGIDWLICGGESGPHFRAMDLDWARRAQSLCAEYGATFFFKQSSGPRPGMWPTLDRMFYRDFPTPRAGYTPSAAALR